MSIGNGNAPHNGIDSVSSVTAPAPPEDSIQSPFVGSLAFKDGYPTPETVQVLYDQLDFQRGTQAFLRNLLALNMHGFRLGLDRDLGVRDSSTLAIFRATAQSLMLTPNSETLYGTTFLSLDTDGPTVVEVPPGVLGLLNDMWMRPVEDLGVGGPDHGQGGKYLFVPPSYEGELPDSGYFITPLRTYGAWLLLRAFLDPSGSDEAAHALLRRTRIYPYSSAALPRTTTYINATGRFFDTTTPNDLRAFEMLADLIAREHPHAIDPEVAGMLKAIGINPGQQFAPDPRLQGILSEAARIGSFMAQAISYAPRKPEQVRPGSQWLAGLEGYPSFFDGRSTLLDPMIFMAWFATGAAKSMNAPKPGTGSQYIWTYHDANGQWLCGEKHYRFRIPPNPPAKDFWSVVVYDNWTRAILPNGQDVASKNSYDQAIEANPDGSIDIWFGPHAPQGKESNWIRTVPGKGWFTLFRLYGPLQPWFDRTWTPNDIEST